MSAETSPFISGSNLRWEAEAALNKAVRDATASLARFRQGYIEQGYSPDAARAKALTHLPIGLRNALNLR